MNLDFDYQTEKLIYTSDSTFTAFKPYMDIKDDTIDDPPNSFWGSDLIKLSSEKSKFTFNPILHYQLFHSSGKSFQGFGAGASAHYSFNDKLSAGIDFAYFAIDYPDYQRSLIIADKAISSQSLLRFNGEMINSNYTSAFIHYSPSQIFDFELGYGRNFIGDGYRSLLLSDHASAYPYLKINTEIWRLKYTNLFSVQGNSFQKGYYPEEIVQKVPSRTKYTATHFLDFKATDWLTVGLFETVVWQREDTIFKRGFDVHFLNPVIFYRPLEFSTGSADNVLMGLNLKARIAKKHILYSQIIIDEFLVSEIRADIKQLISPEKDIQSHWWANKYALQLGLHSFDLFGLKGLESRLEYNFVRPYMYAHSSPDQNYSHANLSLAHPLGANFQEALIHLDYYFTKKWRLHFNYHYSIGGKSFDTLNFGEDILASNRTRAKEYEVETGQGLAFASHYLNTGISYLIQEKWKMYVQLGYLHRSHRNYGTNSENYIYLKLSTSVFNQYFDY